MKFRMVDRITHVDERRIHTTKTISFEEFSLLKPWGRKGAFPESLILQVAVESAALLVAHRTDHVSTSVLEEIESVRFHRQTQPGDVLKCVISLDENDIAEFRMDGTGVPGKHDVHDIPNTRIVQNFPGNPGTRDVPSTRDVPNSPGIPNARAIQNAPGIPNTRDDANTPIATGRLRLRQIPFQECFEQEAFDLMWEAMYVPSRS